MNGNDNEIRRNVVYVRTATNDRDTKDNLDRQESECKAIAEAHGDTMSTTISDVATRSGLTAIREAARKGEVQRIYVATPDRLSRNREECAAILKEFHDSAVDVVFASREWVTTVNRNEGSAGSALDDLIRAIFDRCGTESIMV